MYLPIILLVCYGIFLVKQIYDNSKNNQDDLPNHDFCKHLNKKTQQFMRKEIYLSMDGKERTEEVPYYKVICLDCGQEQLIKKENSSDYYRHLNEKFGVGQL